MDYYTFTYIVGFITTLAIIISALTSVSFVAIYNDFGKLIKLFAKAGEDGKVDLSEVMEISWFINHMYKVHMKTVEALIDDVVEAFD